MIDPQRVAALARAPRANGHRVGHADPASTVTALMALTDLHAGQAGALGAPIAWSLAACRPQEGADGPTSVCTTCPIRAACATAIPGGVPLEVRPWREH
ncbi:hypothetical protein ACN20G_33670 (plasmid) [Streptomyces sp. BI20]|uniref:hypothetical protein n=1 Tax=Streptomyces sp. BI20 TaxID=3403460 RepID=UPI003C779E5E